MAHAHKAARAAVEQKAPNQLLTDQRHDLLLATVAIVLVGQLDRFAVETQQAAVGQRDATAAGGGGPCPIWRRVGPSRGGCGGSGCRRGIRRIGGDGVRGHGRGCRSGVRWCGILAGHARRGGPGELLGIVREQSGVATTGRPFQTGPIENADVTPGIADEAAVLERPRGEGDAAPAHP